MEGAPPSAVPDHVRLDPSVMLVPIQLVRVLPVLPSSSTTAFPSLRNFSQGEWKREWDDVRQFDITTESQPGIRNAKTLVSPVPYSPTNPPVNHTTPDSIWAQCNVQFREINCGTGRTVGCPDVLVESDAEVAPTVCEQAWETSRRFAQTGRLQRRSQE